MERESLGKENSTEVLAVKKARTRVSDNGRSDDLFLYLGTEYLVLKQCDVKPAFKGGHHTANYQNTDAVRIYPYRTAEKKLVHWTALATTAIGLIIALKAIFFDA